MRFLFWNWQRRAISPFTKAVNCRLCNRPCSRRKRTGTGHRVRKTFSTTDQAQVQKGSDFLIEKIMSIPGEITLVAIGPLTNIALAIRQEPRIVENVKEIFIMGGAITP